LTFTDETPLTRSDPVARARRSPAATRKAATQQTAEGSPAHSFHTLLEHLATLTRDEITFTGPTRTAIQKLTTPTPTQRKAFQLLQAVIPSTLT